ncbi:MAG: fibronectin type III domain-containing protein [Patescibacteria group bacterium]
MNKLIKTILIVSIAVFGVGVLFVDSAQAQPADPLTVEFEKTPLFSEANFLPGGGVTRWVKVTNNSNESQRIAVQAINVNDLNHLGAVLNLEIKENGTTLYSKPLSTFFNAGEEFLSNLANNSITTYDFSVSFYSGTQNTFQGKSLGFDILIGFQGTEGGIWPGAGSSSGGGGGGGWLPPGLTIQNEATVSTTEISVTITWTTSYPASSQVIYALGSESHTLDLTDTVGAPPKYGYAHTTPESDISPKVTSHSVTISGLAPGTTYYYRAVSHGSLAISGERSFTTLGEMVFVQPKEKEVAITPLSMSVPAEKSEAETPAAPEQPIEQPVAQTATQNPFAAAIGNFLTLGTGSVWLGILVGLIILAGLIYLAYWLRTRKSSGNIK